MKNKKKNPKPISYQEGTKKVHKNKGAVLFDETERK
jgi:hypothetical protein